MWHRIVVGLRKCRAGAQTWQENGERGQEKWTEGKAFIFKVHASIVNGNVAASSIDGAGNHGWARLYKIGRLK